MSTITDLTKNVDVTPLYAAVGVTDLAVEKVREAGVRAEARRAAARKDFDKAIADLAPAKVQKLATERATVAFAAVKDLPAQTLNNGLVAAGKVTEGYEALATRGQDLVKRIRNQRSTKDLVAQAETAVAQTKGAVTTARKAVADVERSAKATVTTGRKEAVRVAETLIDSVQGEAKVAETEVKTAAKRTRTAAKRTSTTTRNAAKKTTASAKAATTSTRKTAAASTKATKKAAEKVGD